MNTELKNEVVALVKEARLGLKRFYELMTTAKELMVVVKEWYPYSCGKSYLAELRRLGKTEAEQRLYVDDMKLVIRDKPGAPEGS